MKEISSSITTNIDPAKDAFNDTLNAIINDLVFSETIELKDINNIVENSINKNDSLLSKLENDYVIPKEQFKMAIGGMIKGILTTYITEYVNVDPSLTSVVRPTFEEYPNRLQPHQQVAFVPQNSDTAIQPTT